VGRRNFGEMHKFTLFMSKSLYNLPIEKIPKSIDIYLSMCYNTYRIKERGIKMTKDKFWEIIGYLTLIGLVV
jgi:hypothetical protein